MVSFSPPKTSGSPCLSLSQKNRENLWVSRATGKKRGPQEDGIEPGKLSRCRNTGPRAGVGLQARWSLNRRKAQQQGNGCFSRMGCVMNCSLKFLSGKQNLDVDKGRECFLLWCSRPSKTVASILFLDYDSQHRVPLLSQTSNIYIHMK